MRQLARDGSGVVNGWLAAACRHAAVVAFVATMSVVIVVQLAPRGEPGSTASDIGPPLTATFLSVVLFSTKPIQRPSGETNGARAFVTPARTDVSRRSSRRTTSCA